MIRFVVALPAEARPLIERFELTRADAAAFPLWQGAEASLVVCGVGRAAAAAATGYLAGRLRGAGEAAWINVGVGGHHGLAVGEAVLAHKVVEAASGRSWYPPLVFEPPCPTATVLTVDRPETSYPTDAVYEMEAAGFCSAAARFASAELVQVVKVISDNAESPTRRLSGARVQELIGARIAPVARLAEETAILARELRSRRAPPPALSGFLDRWRFTVSERRRLERLLRRLAVLEAAAPEAAELAARPTASSVIAALERRLQAHSAGGG